ncbi:MAG TPA: anti-sigma factor RsbA family regulatory protein [Gaiellaceae bacterium]|jgi:anti-sigma regulatory factor (Ser/Thr protein kinase)|nr:anti-sigma factor RsbA family regulatory protein [Gaiellaceae bacterium]
MPFRHEALLYAGRDEFVDWVGAFVRDAVAAEETVLAVVAPEKIDLLRGALDGEAAEVFFADMRKLGGNPARIIPAWREFVAEHSATGRPVRGVGEPIWPGRSEAELAECRRHESLLNLAFADGRPWWLVCPYDTESLDPAVVEEARRTHPFVCEDGVGRESVDYYGLDAIARPFDERLPDPPDDVSEVAFRRGPLAPLRRFVADHAAGLGAARRADFVLAVHEVVSNSIRHGGGAGTLHVWRDRDALVCEVRDGGRIDDPLVGRERPAFGGPGGRGLWLANQLCDLVQVRSFPHGSVVRVHMRLV